MLKILQVSYLNSDIDIVNFGEYLLVLTRGFAVSFEDKLFVRQHHERRLKFLGQYTFLPVS